jgi:hypothetical protein
MAITANRTSKCLLAAIRQCVVVMTAAAVLGCQPSEAPAAGRISLTFHGMSDSDVAFFLANGLDSAVYVRGNRTLSLAVRTWPRDTGIECETGSKSEEEPLGFAHGKATYIEVSPGEQIRVVVPTTLPQRYKGGVCRISLSLRDGSLVGPIEFRP